MKHKVLIVDDHFVVREGLKLIIETSDQYAVVGEAKDGEEALRLAVELAPDVILMDLNMPRKGGLETIRELKEKAISIPIVILTTYNEDDLMIRGLQLGAKGYLLKDTGREHLFQTLDSAVRGDTLLQPEIMEKVFREKHERVTEDQPKHPYNTVLSEKEQVVLQAIAHGFRSKEIAFDMGISERTVKAHLTHIYNKLGVDSRSQAVAIAVERGLVHLRDN
ncbi:response regulator [Paenibacillus turpanensis]|uniref:response regulator n=1 Tax=Paenibacillus turpanensis TaxID=2689078 RepID=UPI00140C6F6C|nr:response regulator transcription factor [Paenibacillus turpanensis]